jgi:thiol:disulfide interchange protein
MTVHVRMPHVAAMLVVVVMTGACSSAAEGSLPNASPTTLASPSVAPATTDAASPKLTPTSTPTPKSTPEVTATPAPSEATSDWLYDPTRDAGADVLDAIAAAKASGKLVLVDFGADWCPDCHVLADYLHRPTGQAILDESFVLVSVDVGYWDHNLDVVAKYGDAIRVGIPSLVVLDDRGTVLRSTANGAVASAGSMSEEQVLAILRALAG